MNEEQARTGHQRGTSLGAKSFVSRAHWASSILYSRARPQSGLAETGQALVQALPHPKVATEAAGPRGVTQRSTPSPLVMIGNVRVAVRTASCRSRRERFGGPAGGRICVV